MLRTSLDAEQKPLFHVADEVIYTKNSISSRLSYRGFISKVNIDNGKHFYKVSDETGNMLNDKVPEEDLSYAERGRRGKPKGKSIRYDTRNSYIRPSDAISYTTLIVYWSIQTLPFVFRPMNHSHICPATHFPKDEHEDTKSRFEKDVA